MKPTSVDQILAPAELNGRDLRRYWLAVCGWFGFVLSGFLLVAASIVLLAYYLETLFPVSTLQPYLGPAMGLSAILAVAAICAGHHLWFLLFIRSNYLSDSAAIRILSNRAPTLSAESWRFRIGQILLIVIYGGFGVLAAHNGLWWILVIAAPLMLWGLVALRTNRKDVARMLAGGSVASGYAERISFITKVLDERRRLHHDS